MKTLREYIDIMESIENQDEAKGMDKNVVKSVKVGNFRHDLVNHGWGWQVRIYIDDKLYDAGMTKNSEQKGLAALDDAVAYTKKQLNIKDQNDAEENLEESDDDTVNSKAKVEGLFR